MSDGGGRRGGGIRMIGGCELYDTMQTWQRVDIAGGSDAKYSRHFISFKVKMVITPTLSGFWLL